MIRSILVIALLTACTTPSSQDTQSVDSPGQPQLAGGGKADSSHANDPRQIGCALEYEVLAPQFSNVRVATLVTTYGEVATTGAYTGDDTYTLNLHSDDPSMQLPFAATVTLNADGSVVAYQLVPSPTMGGYIFELGSQIAPHRGFNFVRAFCSISAS
jgi:hypothetical protein